jgi:hypothetical protein
MMFAEADEHTRSGCGHVEVRIAGGGTDEAVAVSGVEDIEGTEWGESCI